MDREKARRRINLDNTIKEEMMDGIKRGEGEGREREKKNTGTHTTHTHTGRIRNTESKRQSEGEGKRKDKDPKTYGHKRRETGRGTEGREEMERREHGTKVTND